MTAWTGVTLSTAATVKVPADRQDWMQKKVYDDYRDVEKACTQVASRIGLAQHGRDASFNSQWARSALVGC